MGQDGERVAAALSDAVDALLAAPIARYPRDELLALLRDVDTQLRRLAAVDAVLVGEIDQRHTAAELGAANTSVLLSQLLRIAPGEAAARLRAARDLAPRRGLTGEALAPIFPAVAQALAAGELNPAHARLIGKTIDAIPAEVEQAALGRGEHLAEQVEATLVHQAGRLDLRQLGHLATRLLAHLDPDGAAPADEQAQRRRSLALYPRPDGSGQLRGELTPETVAVWRTILDALSRPAPESDNLPDPRTGGQRRHDALLDAGQRLLRAGDIPDAGGTPVTLLITLTDQQLATGQGYAVTEHGELLPAGTAIRLADQAALTTCQLTATGGILDYGTSRRLATPGMRRALAARDHGCTFPGCTVPASWCQTHHVIGWRAGGPTSLDNLTLLCGHHHRTFERSGWTCQMNYGLPHWTPPRWLDPHHTPRRNTAQHHHLLDPTELLTTSGTAPP
jgi:hypothetical protein